MQRWQPRHSASLVHKQQTSSSMRSFLVVLTLLALTGALLIFGNEDAYLFQNSSSVTHPLASKIIVEHAIDSDGTVSYAYLGDILPNKLNPDEVLRMRTPTSYTTQLAVAGEGRDIEYTMQTVSYPQPVFMKDPQGVWRYIEHATTTRKVWESRPISLVSTLWSLLVSTAHADSISPFTSAGDGFALGLSTDFSPPLSCSWSTARLAVSGSVNYTSTSVSTYSYYQDDGSFSCSVNIYRSFLPFDTSSIPSAATVTAASLSVYVTTVFDDDNDAQAYITISTSTQATHTSLATTDYDNAGPVSMNAASEVIDSGERKDLSSVSASAYLTFTLNANGINAIKRSGESSTCSATAGISCFAMREGHDAAGSTLASSGEGVYSGIQYSSSEATGTSQDPYLSVTYTVSSSFVPWMFSDF